MITTIIIIVLVFLILVGAILASPLGMFLVPGDTVSGSIQSAIVELEEGYHLQAIKELKNYQYDRYEIEALHLPWDEILSVYAVKVSDSVEELQTALVMDPQKREALAETFRDMVSMDFTIMEHMDTILEDGKQTTVIRHVLHVRPKVVTAMLMANEYGFDSEKRLWLDQLLSHTGDLWEQVLMPAV